MTRMLTLLAGLALGATLAVAGAEVQKDGDTSPVRAAVEVGVEVVDGGSKAVVPAPASGEAPSAGARAKSSTTTSDTDDHSPNIKVDASGNPIR